MNKLFLTLAISLVPITQAFAEATINYDISQDIIATLMTMKGEKSQTLVGKGTVKVASGEYMITMKKGANKDCELKAIKLNSDETINVFNTPEKSCGMEKPTMSTGHAM